MQSPPTPPEPNPAAAPPADGERLQLQTLHDLLYLSGDFVGLLQHEVDVFRQTPNQPREVREKTLRYLMIRFDQLSRAICRNVLLSRTLATPKAAPDDRPARPAAPRATAPKPVSQPTPITRPLTRADIAASIRGALGLAEPPANPLQRPPAANPVPPRAACAAKFGPLPMPGPTGTGPPRAPAR